MKKSLKSKPEDGQVDDVHIKLDVDTLEALGANIPSKPPKGYYSIEQLCDGLKIHIRGLMKKIEKLKKENKVHIIEVYEKNKRNIMCHKKYYKISK